MQVFKETGPRGAGVAIPIQNWAGPRGGQDQPTPHWRSKGIFNPFLTSKGTKTMRHFKVRTRSPCIRGATISTLVCLM